MMQLSMFIISNVLLYWFIAYT